MGNVCAPEPGGLPPGEEAETYNALAVSGEFAPETSDGVGARPQHSESSQNRNVQGIAHKGFDSRQFSAHSLEDERAYARIVKHATGLHELPEDVWGAAILVMLKDIPDLTHGLIYIENVMRASLIGVLLLLNIVLQLIFLFWIWKFVASPQVRRTQEEYKAYHDQVFSSSGKFSQDQFLDFVESSGLCGFGLSNKPFLFAILFLWVAHCTNELKVNFRRFRLFNKLPKLPASIETQDMVHEMDNGMEGVWNEELWLICCITPLYKAFIVLAIFVPKALVAVGLAWCGSVWLAASEEFGDLILNSLALSFVMQIDEMLFDCFMPERLRDNLRKTKIANQEEALTSEELQRKDKADMFEAYSRSWGFLLFTILFVMCFLMFQPVLPGFADDIYSHCTSILEAKMTPLCKFGETDCFPY
eukprot:TRINITY_DN105875_c0_g1_i1.p1 TRINITY_DN105875_c0_g1~~TRINITY_DN105875_c0_g1_i1.p1  ORF type:complete len:431 (-),score=83.79 TRINITY_DN105875_c0_g1_i1:179-1429(-)